MHTCTRQRGYRTENEYETHTQTQIHTQQYTVVQKQVQVPVVTKTVAYQPIQYQVPVYQPFYHKRIHITAPYPQVINDSKIV